MLKNNRDIHKILVLAIGIIWLFIGLHCKRKEMIDMSGIEVNLSFKRFEQDLFSLPFDSIKTEIPRLEAEYMGFFDIFNYAIIKIGSPQSAAYPEYIKMYLTNFQVNKIYMESQKVFSDLSGFSRKLTKSFRYYKYYFPNKEIPEIYTFIGRDLSHASIATDDGILAIAIDKYMGNDCRLYYESGFYKYIIDKMVPERMVADCMRGWGITEFAFKDSINDLLNNIIYEGKMMYLAKKLLPEEQDTIITGFSSDQLDFCRNNEYNMWNYLVENKLLFSTDYFTINQFINDGPFTKDFTKESPARAAVWIGYRIVESFMKKNPKISLSQLMEIDDSQRILEQSGYNP